MSAAAGSHTKARSELNVAYQGRRLDVPDRLVSWDAEWPKLVPGDGRGAEPSTCRRASASCSQALPDAEGLPVFQTEAEARQQLPPGRYQPGEGASVWSEGCEPTASSVGTLESNSCAAATRVGVRPYNTQNKKVGFLP